MRAIHVVVQAPRTVRIESREIAHPEAGRVLVETRHSGISPGTEMLFYRGEAPVDEPVDSAIPAHRGALAYPLHYGYACAGMVAALGEDVDPALLHQRVFVFYPHASAFHATPEQLVPIPDDIPDRHALLFPNAETAVNLVQDGHPLIGERVLVLGLGVVGLLVAAALARILGVSVTAIDPLENRRTAATALGVQQVAAPDQLDLCDFDLVYELTGRPETLATAIAATGFAGRIIVGSWYGAKSCSIPFDTHFHRDRIRIISSQVSTIAPELSARWDKPRRYDLAWRLLHDLPLDAFDTQLFPVDHAAEAFALVDQHPESVIQAGIDYAALHADS